MLIVLANQLSPNADEREMDLLLSSGERISAALTAIAINELGFKSMSFTGRQVGIITDDVHTKAKIEMITGERVRKALDKGIIPVIAGFQGITETSDVTTLGRGGSDLTAVAVAAALEADLCEIYTDVDGGYTTDPGIVPDAKQMEKVVVSGVAYDKNQAKITAIAVHDKPGIAAKLFNAIAGANIVVDMIVQNISSDGKSTDISFTVPKPDRKKALKITEEIVAELGAKDVVLRENIAKVSIIGVGMRTHSGVAAKMFETVAKHGINIMMISTSEIKISCI